MDAVLPEVPIRQWTLAFPWRLRWLLLRDGPSLSLCLRELLRATFAWQRRRARRQGAMGTLECGAVSMLQLFSGALQPHPHFHVLVPDGVFAGPGCAFVAVPPPSDEEVTKVLERVVRRVTRRLEAAGVLAPQEVERPEEDSMEALQWYGLQERLALAVEPLPRRPRAHQAVVDGFSLHAGTAVQARDRDGLERLARYGARGPLCEERLTRRDDGRYEYALKRPLRSGATALVLTPLQLLRRAGAVLPQERKHLLRFHGVLAPNAKARAQVVPKPAPPPLPPGVGNAPLGAAPKRELPRRPRLDWATLLHRTWAVDIMTCRCGGRRRVLAVVTSRAACHAVLAHLGLPAGPPPLPRACSPPQLPLGL
ncbi:MAG: transposase [Myxococcales bacterium]|nr:transposase [Myxococcales bacterium]